MRLPRRADPLLERIDRRLERGDKLMAEVREEMRLSREAHADLRTFIRDLTRGNEVVMQAMIGELSDLRDQTQANTQAVLRVLDRLDTQDG